MKTYYLYILECSDKSYYTGTTTNLEKRFNEHNSGLHDGYTKTRRPVKLVFYQEFYDANQAFFAERKIKGWSRNKKNALIQKKFDLLPILSECKNKSHHRNK